MSKTLIVIILIALCTCPNLLAQNSISWESLFEKADKQYIKGKYDKAIKVLDKKIPKTIRKDLGEGAVYSAWIDVYRAQLAVVKGDFMGLKDALEKAQSALDEIKSQNPKEYFVAQLKILNIRRHLGAYQKIEEKIKALDEFRQAQSLEDLEFKAELNLLRSQNLLAQGHLNEALTLISETQAQWEELRSQTSSALGSFGKNDQIYRNAQYIASLNTWAKIYQDKGLYAQADSLLRASERNANNLASSHPELSDFYITWGQNFFDQDEFREAEKKFEKAQGSVKKYHHYHLVSLFHVLRANIYNDKESSFSKGLSDYDKLYGQYFSDYELYGLYEDFVNGEADLLVGEYTRARPVLEAIWRAPESDLPMTHPLRIQAAEELYYLNLDDRQLERARNFLDSNLIIRQEIYGKSSINYKAYQIKLAHFLFKNSDDFEQIKLIMEDQPQETIFSQRAETHKDYINVGNTVVDYYELQDRYKEALAITKKQSEILFAKHGEKDLRYGFQLSRQAELELRVGEYKEAEASAQKSLDIIRKRLPRRSEERAESLALMARIYGTIGLYDEAESLLRTSDRIYKRLEINDLSERGSSIEDMAFLYIRIGKYAETELLLKEVLSSKEAKYGSNNYRLTRPLTQLGTLALIKGEYSEAETLGERAAKISMATFGNNSTRNVGSFALLARYFATIGDYERAEEYQSQIIEIQEKFLGDNHVELGKSLANLALIKLYRDKEKNATTAAELIQAAEQIIIQNFDARHPLYAEVLQTKGVLLVETQKYNDAFVALNLANQIWEEKLEARNLSSAEAYSLIGDVYVHLKKFDEAQSNYEKAELIYKKVLSKEHPDYVNTQSKLGRMYFVKGDYGQANKILDRTTASYLEFIKTYFPALSEREKEKFWAKIRSDFEFFNTLAITQAEDKPDLIEKMYDFQLATKAILLSSSIKVRQAILNGSDEELKEVFQNWLTKKEELNQLLSMTEEQMAENEVSPIDLRNEVNDLEKELSRRSTLFADNVEQEFITWKDVRKVLGKEEAAVEIIRFRKYEEGFSEKIYYAALIVRPDTRRNPELVLLENGDQMEGRYLRYYRNMVKASRFDKYSYKTFWEKVAEKVNESTRVYVSPDGVFNQVNILGLQVNEEEFVIDKEDIRLVSNTKDLVIAAREAENKPKDAFNNDKIAGKKVVLFGNPKFYSSKQTENSVLSNDTDRDSKDHVAELPGTEAEVQAIKKELEASGAIVDIFRQEEAGEDVLKKLSDVFILHIATHGFFNAQDESNEAVQVESSLKSLQNDPLRQTGVLAKGAGDLLAKTKTSFDRFPGIWTAYEAMSAGLDACRVVVLSACETGLGKVAAGEGVYGLQRSFLVAGSDAVIMSLFKVNDAVTKELMVSFYAKLIELEKAGEPGQFRKAFKEAQLMVKEKYPDPSLWASFIMIGS